MNNYINTANRWTVTLRTLIGYPPFAPLTDAVMFAISSCQQAGKDEQLAQIAVDSGKDIVHLVMDERGGLPTASLIIRCGATVRVMNNLKVYASDETSPVEFLSNSGCWSIGPRYILTEHKLPSLARQKRGREIAKRRWQEMFETQDYAVLEGSKFVKLGERLADAIPFDELNIAA